MGRVILLLALAYGYGHPAWGGYRPGPLDRPLREFQRTVDAAVSDGRRALALLDEARRMRYLETGLRNLGRAL
jgi:hypothetical protein